MECPICLEPLTGTISTLGCCKQDMQIECLIQCMKMKLTCPLCRAEHQSLRMIQNNNVVINTHPLNLNRHFFRDSFIFTFIISAAAISISYLE